jgi:probable DNA metabolism protein
MLLYNIEDSIEGLFSAVFTAYKFRERPEIIGGKNVILPLFITKTQDIATDAAHFERVKKGILNRIGAAGLEEIYYAFACGHADKNTIILKYIVEVFKHGKAVLNMLTRPEIIAFLDCAQKTRKEVKHYMGFVRFKETEDGYYYAQIKPDNDVVQFIMPHFCDRYKAMHFVIHDVARNIAGLYNANEYKLVSGKKIELTLSENERLYSGLWKQYFDNTAIPERKNKRLQRQFMPMRYREFMEENAKIDEENMEISK